MAKARRVRWECPSGEHPAVLGSTRPPKDAVVRFCLPCSANATRLVARVAPALEAQRAARTRERQVTAAFERERDRQARAAARKVTVLDYGVGVVTLDAGELLEQAWRSKALRDAAKDSGYFRGLMLPQLTLRRGDPERGRAARRARAGSGRERDAISGHAKTYRSEIVLTVAPGLGREWLEAIVVHEAAHCACPDDHHGRTWRSTYIRAMRELYGVRVLNTGQAAWRLDEGITLALREIGRAGL